MGTEDYIYLIFWTERTSDIYSATQLSTTDSIFPLVNEVSRGNGREVCGFHFNPPLCH